MMHTQSGAASFAACLRLFRFHPLAVVPPAPGGVGRSMVLRHRTGGFFVLSQRREDAFALRPWHGGDGISEEIRPGESVPDVVGQVLAGGMPVPRHGALLGWVMTRQVTALLAAHGAPPAPGADTAPVPEIRVLPLDGTSARWHWPPFTVSPLDDFRLWEYVEWGEIVDIAPLLTRAAGRAFWVPAGPGRRTGHVVVRDNLRTGAFWLPAGTYADHWAMREGIEPPPAGELLARPGAVDLARGNAW